MVQKKGPDIGVRGLLSTNAQAKKEKPPSSQDGKNDKEAAGASQLKRRLKKARSIKRAAELGELDAHLGPVPPPEKLREKPHAAAKSDHGMPPAKPNKLSKPPKSSSQEQPPVKPPGAKGADSTLPPPRPPNYMKGTNSSDARKEQQRQVRFRPTTPPPVTPEKTKIPKSPSTPSKPPKPAAAPAPMPSLPPPPPPPSIKKSNSIKKSAKMLTKKLSLKPIRSLMRKCTEALMFQSAPTSKPTCSSTLKDSKFPKELELNAGGTEAEGTSAVKVCPFNHCSLNGHYHEPVPPLKRFVSMRRRSLKKQKSMKLRQLSVKKRGSVKGLKRAKSRKGIASEALPATDLDDGDEDFFIEVYDEPQGGSVDHRLHDNNMYENGHDDDGDGKARFQRTETAQVPSEGLESVTMNSHTFDGSNTSFLETDDNGEADFRSTGRADVLGLELRKRRSLKVRQLSVRRRSLQRSLKQTKSRKRISVDVSPAIELADDIVDNFLAEIYDDSYGGSVDSLLYYGNNKYDESDDSVKAKFGSSERVELPSGGLKKGAIKEHLLEDSNTYGKHGDSSEADIHRTKGAEATTDGKKDAKQRLMPKPTEESYTELSFDDNFDMVSEASFSETDVIEQFLEYIERLSQEHNAPANSTLPVAHKDRRRWDSGWDPDRNMVFATTSYSQDEQESKLVADAMGTVGNEETSQCATTSFDGFVGSNGVDQSNESSALIDPSFEIEMGETILQSRNEASFTMDDIYCRFNSADSENNTKGVTKDSSDQRSEHLFAEEGDYEKDKVTEAEVIPDVAEGKDDDGFPEVENNGASDKCSSEIETSGQDINLANHEACNIPDVPKATEIATSDSLISACEEATKELHLLDDHTDCCSTEQLDQDSLEGEKDKGTEKTEESIQPKPTAEDSYDKLARKAIEDAVEEVYIYNVLKGSEGPEIIKAIADAIESPKEGLQGAQSKFKITRNRAVAYLDKIRSFNPRAPNFLPVEPDPEAERVDLRHQEMNEKKNAEEWMVDYALQRLLRKLSPAQKKVTLMVKAYEAVISEPTSDNSLQRGDMGFARARPLQACG